MYYQLGTGGRFLWSFTVFLTWCVVTFFLMRWAIIAGMGVGDVLHEGARTVRVNPASADVFKILAALLGFFVVPIITTFVISSINKKMKGQPSHEQKQRALGIDLHRITQQQQPRLLPQPRRQLPQVPHEPL